MKKTFCFVIVVVIMTLVDNNDYNKARPIESTVKLINELYNQGNKIILNTARGFVTKIDWKEVTIAQLERMGLKYHEIYFNKPAADYYIDDRMISIEDANKIINK